MYHPIAEKGKVEEKTVGVGSRKKSFSVYLLSLFRSLSSFKEKQNVKVWGQQVGQFCSEEYAKRSTFLMYSFMCVRQKLGGKKTKYGDRIESSRK